MNASVIVYGPQRCGKTRNADALRRHFGLHQVIELDEHRGALPRNGALILTHDAARAELHSQETGIRMVPYRLAAKAAGVTSC